MKRLLIYLSIFLFCFSSCKKDVLDKVPLDIISDNTLWSDQALIDAYLTGAYSKMYILTNETYGNDWNTGESWPVWSDINSIADEGRQNWVITVNGYKNGNLKIGGGLLEWWENSYNVIRTLNEFIKRVPTSPVDNAFKKRRVAEARFLRAYNYFSMVKRYGGVPLVTVAQSVKDPIDSLYPKRAKEQEVYDFVIEEMEAIKNDLPETIAATDVGRPGKFAALALESRAALYAGSIAKFGTIQLNGVLGIPASSAQSYFQKSYDASKEIIDGNKFSLYNKQVDKATNFRRLFLDKNNPEAIFVRPHTYSNRDAGGNGWAYDFFQCPSPMAWGGGNQDGPYLEMAEEFEYADGTPGKLNRDFIQQGLWTTDQLWKNKDPRFFATIFTQNTPWKGALVDFHYGINKSDGTIQTDGSYNGKLAKGDQAWAVTGTGFGVLKYLDEAKDNFGERGTSGTDWIVFRYGEILLNYAEAAFELGDNNDATLAINKIRERAGIAPITLIDRDKIRHERKVELAYEGHRYWDLRRWRTAVTDLSINNSGLRYVLDDATGNYKLIVVNQIDGTNGGPAFYSFNYYLPITLARTANNKNLVENPGY